MEYRQLWKERNDTYERLKNITPELPLMKVISKTFKTTVTVLIMKFKVCQVDHILGWDVSCQARVDVESESESGRYSQFGVGVAKNRRLCSPASSLLFKGTDFNFSSYITSMSQEKNVRFNM